MSLLRRLRIGGRVGAGVLLGVTAWQGAPVWAQAASSAVPDTEDAAPVPAPTPTNPTTEAAPQPTQRTRAPARWTLDIRASADLADLLRAYLDISRYQQEVVDGEPVRVSRSELRRLVSAIPAQARSLLEAEGYFGAEITVSVKDGAEGAPQHVVVAVQEGVRTRIRDTRFVFEGDLDQRLSDEELDDQALLADIRKAWGLQDGALFTQSAWSASKNAALARMRAEGYPAATWSGTSATVDASTNRARLFLVADSGPLFHFGEIKVEGLAYHPLSSVINVSPLEEGTRYQERMLLDWQERIQKLNLFENVFVSADPDPAQPGVAPVRVSLRELPLQTATTGVGLSSDTGPRVTLEHLHRNPFRTNWISSSKLQWGTKESLFQLDLTSHPWPGRRRGLASAEWSRTLDSYDSETLSRRLRIGRLQEGERLERTSYVEWQSASVTDRDGVLLSDASAVSVTGQWILRAVDNQVLPLKGYTALGQVTGGHSLSTLKESGLFTRLYGRVNGYLPLARQWHLTTRAELGQVFSNSSVSIPDTLLFRAGGDESVRGYAYRSLGVTVDDVVIGGRSMYAASVELAHPIPGLPPAVWGAVFADVGDAADDYQSLSANTGYGLGVRWRSPVGPLRLDVAYGTKVQAWRLHFSVGISL